jgi:SAM-dependent methyltransferase
METIDLCPYCNSNKKSVLGIQQHQDKYLALIDENLNKNKRYWYLCKSCDFIYRSPRTTREEESLLYSKYRHERFRGLSAEEYFDKITSISDSDSFACRKAKYLRDTLKAESIRTVLDVGCGGGILLYHLKRFLPKSKMTGLEPNRAYASMVENKLNIKVIKDVYRPGVVAGIFDLILATDVIEHIADIWAFWKAVIHNVDQNSFVFIGVPSATNFKTLDIENDTFEIPHLYFFLPKHIQRISNEYGFELKDFKRVIEGDVKKDYLLFCYSKDDKKADFPNELSQT